MSSGSETIGIERWKTSLQRMWSYVTWALQRSFDESETEVQFAWDWDVFQEAAEAGSSTAHYGGHLWHALECLRSSGRPDGRWKVVLTEGTRRELLVYLTKLLSDVRQRHRDYYQHTSSSKSEFRRTRLQEFAKHPDWTKVLETLAKLIEAEESVYRLVILLERYTRPAPLQLDAIPTSEVNHYRTLLDRIRPEAKTGTRNEADAYNLACVDHLSRAKRGHESSFTLVTTTHAVRSADRTITIDPIQFAFESQLRTEFDTADVRCQALLSMQETLSRQLQTVGRHTRLTRTEDVADLPRHEVQGFLRDIEAIHKDQVLHRLGKLVQQMEQSARNSLAQLRDGSPAVELTLNEKEARFDSVLQRLMAALKAVDVNHVSADDVGLRLVARFIVDDIRQFTVVDSKGRDIIELEHTGESLALRWETEETIDSFLETISEFSRRVPVRGDIVVSVRTDVRPDRLTTTVPTSSGIAGIWKAAVNLARDTRIATLIVGWDTVTFWYQAHELRSPGTGVPMQARIALRSALPIDADAIFQVYGSTATHWLFPGALTELIEGAARVPTTQEDLPS